MVKVSEIYDYIDSFAPFSTALNWDNVGLLVGDKEQEVDRILITLDCSLDVLDEAESCGVKLVICHHPIIFKPITQIDSKSVVSRAIKDNISVICAHTNLDLSAMGVNYCLSQALELDAIRGLNEESSELVYCVSVYVPRETVGAVRDAMIAAGAGQIGNYDGCAFKSDGIGFFRPLLGAKPSIGAINQSERVEESKLEMFCRGSQLKKAIHALKLAHPYEEPVFSVVRDHSGLQELSMGLMGELPSEMDTVSFLDHVCNRVNASVCRYSFPIDKKIKKVGICGGSGAGLLKQAIRAGCDVLVTGDVSHDVWYEALQKRIGLVDAGHFATENLVVAQLEMMLKMKFSGLDCKEAASNVAPFGVWFPESCGLK